MKIELTREKLLELSAQVIDRAIETVRQALKDANMSMADITAFELIGGASRVPALQKAMETAFNRSLSYSLNADEAIAMGAAYYSASLSAYYRVKTFESKDKYPFQIDFSVSGKEQDNKGLYTIFAYNFYSIHLDQIQGRFETCQIHQHSQKR